MNSPLDLTQELQALAARQPGAYALLQGYSSTGFLQLQPSALQLSPPLANLQNGAFELPWALFSDIRVFHQGQEFHAWRLGSGLWYGRSRSASELAHTLPRQYPLWGRRTVEEKDGWVRRTEDRGTSVWIPAKFDQPQSRPVLNILQILEQHPETNLFGVTDAMITGFDSVEVRDE